MPVLAATSEAVIGPALSASRTFGLFAPRGARVDALDRFAAGALARPALAVPLPLDADEAARVLFPAGTVARPARLVAGARRPRAPLTRERAAPSRRPSASRRRSSSSRSLS